ncbi:MAG: hypothetical protein WBO36_10095, partial [Saprospiraceae bacterium]
MNTNIFKIIKLYLLAIVLVSIASSCERDVTGLDSPSYSTNPAVFIDGFSSGLNYAAFGGSVPTAFDVDKNTTYNNSAAAMKFAVPDINDPKGSYAGGVFFTGVGRDLSGYNVLTFWAKASQPASIDVIGFGNDLGENKYNVSVSALKINTNWKKYILPIPDPSKLKIERGMLYYAEGPENERGYTFWIDEVKFEKLGSVSTPTASILNGQNQEVTAENGQTITLTGLKSTVNLPTGIDQSVEVSPYYLTFSSSNPAVAMVNEKGIVTVISAGTAVITAKLGENTALGALTVKSVGAPIGPAAPAPVPTRLASNVISLYSNVYTNVPVDTWNTRWQFSTAEEFFIKVAGDDVIKYRNLNFVGIEFTSKTIDATTMTHFHLNIYTPDPTDPPKNFKVLLVDFGADGKFGGGDDSSSELTFTSPLLTTDKWITLSIPLANFTGLKSRSHLAQLVLSGDVPNVFVDNVYFFKEAVAPTMPTVAAPTPTIPAADVISIFSNAYTNVAGTDFNPNWGQATTVSQISVAGNTTLKYAGLN